MNKIEKSHRLTSQPAQSDLVEAVGWRFRRIDGEEPGPWKYTGEAEPNLNPAYKFERQPLYATPTAPQPDRENEDRADAVPKHASGPTPESVRDALQGARDLYAQTSFSRVQAFANGQSMSKAMGGGVQSESARLFREHLQFVIDTALTAPDRESVLPWVEAENIIIAAERAAEWIAQARAGAKAEQCYDVIHSDANVAPKDSGKKEMRALRKSVRELRHKMGAAACLTHPTTDTQSDAVREAVLAERERCAGIVQKRMDDRFAEYGIVEPDTNYGYYPGSAGETYETLDEEGEEIIKAIRNEAADT